MSTSIPDDKIAEIKGSCNIVHLISEYVSLKKYGVNYRGLCPFHAENEPSFTVSEAKQIFYCFGCDTGGNIFTFLMKFEHLPFPEAVKQVAQKYGIELPRREYTPRQKQLAGEKEQLFALNELAAAYFSNLLNTRAGEKARSYLASRHMSPETIREFKLGYASPSWDGLLIFLKEKGASLEAAYKLGLLKQSTKNTWYDGFRNRIIFPIIDYNGRIPLASAAGHWRMIAQNILILLIPSSTKRVRVSTASTRHYPPFGGTPGCPGRSSSPPAT